MCLEFIIFACIPLIAVYLDIMRLLKHVKLCLMNERRASIIIYQSFVCFKTVRPNVAPPAVSRLIDWSAFRSLYV